MFQNTSKLTLISFIYCGLNWTLKRPELIFETLVSLLIDISTFTGNIMLMQPSGTILTHNWRDKGVHAFPKGTSPKVNLIVQLEFEPAYYDVTV